MGKLWTVEVFTVPGDLEEKETYIFTSYEAVVSSIKTTWCAKPDSIAWHEDGQGLRIRDKVSGDLLLRVTAITAQFMGNTPTHF